MSDRRFDWLRIVLLALAVAGLLLSGQLVRMHAGEKVADSLDWACGGVKHTCQTVLQSGFARLMIFPPRPVPVAAVGMGYFTFLGLWLLMTGRLPGRLHQAWSIPSIVGLLGLAASGFMVYLMAGVLKAWCGFCLATHIVNLPLVLGIWILWLKGQAAAVPRPGAELPAVAEGGPAAPAPVVEPAPATAMGHLWGRRSYAGLYGFGVYALFEILRSEPSYLRSDQLGWWLFFFLPVVIFYSCSVVILRRRSLGKSS